MTKAFQNVQRQAMKLSNKERRLLANQLLDKDKLDPEWAEEIDRRVREIDEGKVKTIPGEKVLKEIRAKYAKVRK